MNSLSIKNYLIIDDNCVSLTSFNKFEDKYFCIFHQELLYNNNLNEQILALVKYANNFLESKVNSINIVLTQKKYQVNNECKILCSDRIEQNEVESMIRSNYKKVNKHIVSIDNCEILNKNNENFVLFDCLTCDIAIIENINNLANKFEMRIESIRTEFDLVDENNNPILFIENDQVYMLAKLENNGFTTIDYTNEFETMLIKVDDNYNIGFDQTMKLINVIDKCSILTKNFEIAYFAKNKFKKGNYVLKNDFVSKLNKNFNEFIAKIVSKPIQIISSNSCWNNKNCINIKTNTQLSMIICNQKKSILLEKLLNSEPSLIIKYNLVDQDGSKINSKNDSINQEAY